MLSKNWEVGVEGNYARMPPQSELAAYRFASYSSPRAPTQRLGHHSSPDEQTLGVARRREEAVATLLSPSSAPTSTSSAARWQSAR